MNPLDVSTPDDVRDAFISGEFKRLVKYDANMGEVEKKHILASTDSIIALFKQSMQAQFDIPPTPVDLYVMSVVSPIHGLVYNYVFADKVDAIASAKWYSIYAGWVKGKGKDMVVESGETESFVYRMLDARSGDFVVISNSRLSFTSLSPNVVGT